jgi:hypothetical protein
MKPRLQEKLYKKYPELFVQKDWSPTKTCMNWGITCDDGWYPLLDKLCASITTHDRRKDINNKTQAAQVKEKFGGLRFYVDNGDASVHGMISLAESMSYSICEICSRPGRLRKYGWFKTLCGKCNKKRINQIGKRRRKIK